MVEEKLSIPALEQILETKKAAVQGLRVKRDRIVQQLEEIDGDIARVEGKSGRARRPSASVKHITYGPRLTLKKNGGKSLLKWVVDVLAVTPGLRIAEIHDAVLDAGYQTQSTNFKNTLYQCLYHNEDTFVSKKGKYSLTKAAATSAKATANA